MSEILFVTTVHSQVPLVGSPRSHLKRSISSLWISLRKSLSTIYDKIQMIPFSDPSASYGAHKKEIDDAMQECLIRVGLYWERSRHL